MRVLRWLLVGFVCGFVVAFVVALLRSHPVEQRDRPPARHARRARRPEGG